MNNRLGDGRSIQLSYGDNYEFSLILRGFSRSGQDPGLYSEAISIRRMAFLRMDFRPLKAIIKNQMARGILFGGGAMFPQPGGKAIHESGLLKIQTTYIIYNI